MTVPKISVRNRQQKARVNVTALQEFAEKVVRLCIKIRRKESTDLTKLPKIFVWVISDRRMARLHRQFLGQTRSTDVLTFQHGEIFISVETARKHARVFGNSLVREIQLYIVHGLLHLHGFDDRTQAEAHKMQMAQEKILRAL